VNMLTRGRLQRSRVGLGQLRLDDIEINVTHHALTRPFQASPRVSKSQRVCKPWAQPFNQHTAGRGGCVG
jgi:hypothetical protein